MGGVNQCYSWVDWSVLRVEMASVCLLNVENVQEIDEHRI